MKNKRIAVIILVVGILLIITGLSLGIYTYINKNNEKTKEYNRNILAEYDLFKNNIDSFNEMRTIYYNDVAKNLYPESVDEEYVDWLEILNSYTESIDKVEKSSKVLKEECVNKFHSNNDVKNKCDSFVIAYETVMNYYTKDVISFNETINAYLANKKDEDIKNYELKYDYTDINLDGKFIGKD